MSLYIHVAIWLALLAIGAGGGWQVRAWKAGADEKAQIEQINRDALRRVEVAGAAAVKFEDKKTTNTVRRRAADQEIRRDAQNPVYAGNCLSPDGLRLLTDEINRNPHAGEPATALPAASSAGGNIGSAGQGLGDPGRPRLQRLFGQG